MINVSNEFKKLMTERQDFKEYAEVTFLDGTVVTLDENDFSISNNSIVDAADNNAIPIGTAVCRSIQLELLNDDGHLEEYEFYGAKVRLFLTFALSDTVEKIEYGTFTVTSPESYGTVVSVNAFDDMYKANAAYSSDLTFPASAGSVLRDACQGCGIALADSTFLHDDFVIQSKPSTEYTIRQIIGYIAMIACGNARINRLGKLEIITYDLDFDSGDYHDLTEWVNLTLGTNDITVTGIQTTKEVTIENNEGKEETEKVIVSAGEEGYVLTVENPLVKGNEKTLVSWIHERISGISFRKITGDYIAYPLAEFMDKAKITDWKGNIYYTFLTDINFTFFGLTTFKNSAEEGLRNSSKYTDSNTKTNIYLQELIKKERTAREKALENLNIILAGASGVYTTSEKKKDGSYIHYLHNKSTLEESSMIWKMTAEAWAVSSDGGKTWNAGMTVDGDFITKMLTAMGVNADWINTGAITVKDDDGNIIFQVDMDTNKVILSGDSIQIGDKSINDAIKETKNLSMQLSNEFQTITTDADGNISGTFPLIATRAIVMYGSQDITSECSYTVTKSDAVTGKWDDSTKSYTVTGLTADEGWVDIKATYISSLSVVKRFTIAKLKAGKDGINGKDGVNGKDGTNGKDGISITVKSSSVTYQASSSGTEVPTGNWLGSVPSVSNGQYLWTKTTVTYSDGTSVTSYGVSYKGTNGTNGKDGTDGEKGDPGADGRGISSASVTYQASSSGITAPTGTWSSSIPEVSEGQYLWTKTVINYTSGSPTTSYSVSKIGKDGTNGISPTVSLTKSDGTTTITIKDATGTHTQTVKDGTDGTPGEPGIDGKTPYFHVKYSNDGGKTFTSNNGETAGDYIGTCTDYNEADPTAVGAYSWALIKGDKGDTGVAGAKGDTGATGAKGDKGDTGEAGRTYFIEPSCNVLKRSSDNNFSPGFIEFKAYYRDGTSATRTAYNGRFVIEETSDGNTWTTIYTSSANENTVKHYLYSIPVDGDSQAIADSATMIGIPRDVTNIRCKLYAAGGTTTLIDMESVAVVVDVDALTHEEIFNLLTNNGAVKGIYKEGNQLYISFTYAKGGTLTLGGVNNGNGLLKILDASGNQVGYIDNTGVNFTKGTFSGTLSAASGTFKGDVSGATGTFKGDISGATGTFTGGINAASGNIGGWIIDKTNGTLKSANGKIVLNSKDDKILINDVPMYAYGSGLIIDGGFTIRVGNDDFSDGTDRFQLCNISTLTSGNYLRLYSNAVYQSSSSSKRYKEIGQDISEKDIESWYNIQPVWAKYKDGYLTKNDPRNGIEFPMFIAEDVEEYFPLAVDHLEDGKAENWNERIMIPAMFAMLKQQKTEIDALKQELQELKNLLREE